MERVFAIGWYQQCFQDGCVAARNKRRAKRQTVGDTRFAPELEQQIVDAHMAGGFVSGVRRCIPRGPTLTASTVTTHSTGVTEGCEEKELMT